MADNLEKIAAQIACRHQTELLNIVCGALSIYMPTWLRDAWAKVLEITSDVLEDSNKKSKPKRKRIDHGI